MNPTAQAILQFLQTYWVELVCGIVIVAVVPLIAGYVVLVERKLMADMQARLGPMRVGPHGLLQPIADAVKLLIKEDIVPRDSDAFIFWFAPVISMVAALTSMGALYFGPAFRVANDINVGILFVVGVSSLGFLGIILGGWASNSHYSILGAIRSTAQLVSYETAGGLAIISALLLSGTLKIQAIVDAQSQYHVWFIFLAPVGFFTYLVASIAETNRAPFDLPEAESELVAGYMTEYSGFRWALYFLGEYANMIVVASVATTLFLGGWLRPFPNVHWLNWLDFLPVLLITAVGAYCLYRAGKQPVKIQTGFMWAVALGCFAVALMFLAALDFRSSALRASWLERRFLVPSESLRLHLHFHVAALYSASLSLRPAHAPWLVHPDSSGHRQRFLRRRRHAARIGIWLEPLARCDRYHRFHLGGFRVSRAFER